MGFFHNEKNVKEYIAMADGFDGRELISAFAKALQKNSTVLELGMGPGTDLSILAEYFQVTGSDYSELFVSRYLKQNPDSDVHVIDAVTINTDRKFQGIYSNKVLIHLTRDQLKDSIKRQTEILEPGGMVCHSFWVGDKEEDYGGLNFVYYTAQQIRVLFRDAFDILQIEIYQEMEPDDSLYIIARKK